MEAVRQFREGAALLRGTAQEPLHHLFGELIFEMSGALEQAADLRKDVLRRRTRRNRAQPYP